MNEKEDARPMDENDRAPGPYLPAEIRPREGRVPQAATAGAFLVREGRLLLERRPPDARVYPGCWDTPGGHVEAGETPEAALARELAEELGIVPERFMLGVVQDDLEPGTGTFYRHYVYVVRAWEGTPRSREAREVRWFPLEEAEKLPSLNPLVGWALRFFRARGWFEGGERR